MAEYCLSVVTIQENSDLHDAVRCLSIVPNTANILRIVIKIDESTAPVVSDAKRDSPQKKKWRSSGTTAASTSTSVLATPPLQMKLSFLNKTNSNITNIFEDNDYEENFDRRSESAKCYGEYTTESKHEQNTDRNVYPENSTEN